MSGLTTLALREQTTYQRDEIDSLKARVRLLETQEIPFVSRLRIDAKGDLFAGTADNAYARLAVGANGDLLIADSTETTGLRWGAATAAVISDFVEAAQDAVGGALTDSSTIDFTYNDGANTITAIVIDNSISNAKLRQGAALSVIGRSANSTGNVDDISAGTDGHVLRRSGTTLGFGTVATAGITDSAVTTAKILDANVTDAKLRNSGALSVIGRSANSTGVPADISAGTDGHVLRRSGTSLGFGTVATAGITDAAITDAKLRNSAALSVIGRSANSSGVPADISAGTDDHVLRRSGTTLGFGTVATAGITDAAITNAKLGDMSQGLIKGRGVAAGTGPPQDLSAANVNAIIGTTDIPMMAAITWSAAFSSFQSNAVAMIYGTSSAGGSYPFLEAGNLVIQARSSSGALRDIVFATGGTTPSIAMVLDRNGRLGIGISSPTTLLDVNGNTRVTGTILPNSSQAAFPTNTLNLIYSTTDAGGSYPFLEAGNLVIQARSSSGGLRDIVFAAGGTTPSVAAVIDRNGRLGIGISSPTTLLDVNGDTRITGTILPNSSQAAFPTNTLNLIYSTTGAGGSYPFLEAGNLVIQARSSSGGLRDIVFAAGGTTPSVAVIIDRNGRLGIGISSPTTLLDVNGNTRITGTILPNSSQAAFPTNTLNLIYSTTSSGGSYPFLEAGNLVIQARSSSGALRDIVFATGGTTPTIAAVIDRNGRLGVGTSSPNSKLSVQAGTSSDHANVGGVIYYQAGIVGNVSTGEQDLMTFSVPANTLANNGDTLWFEVSGRADNSLNSKTLRIRFGASGTNLVIQSDNLRAGTTNQWVCRGRIIRTGSTTTVSYATIISDVDGVGMMASVRSDVSQTLSSAVTFRVTGQATLDNELEIYSLVIGWEPSNT